MATSEKTGRLMLAIRAVQRAMPLAAKSGTVKIEGAQTRIEKFAPHDEIWERLQPILDANGLTVVQPPDIGANGGALLVTRITWTSEDGSEEQWIEGTIPVNPPRSGFRELGASWSYERRIMLLSCFGIVAGGDEPDQQEADKLRHVKPPRENRAARPHMSEADSEAAAERILSELAGLPTGSTLAQVDELAKQFAGMNLKDEVRTRIATAFANKRQELGLPAKQSSKRS